MDYFELECAVEHWAEEKGILAKATPMAYGELYGALQQNVVDGAEAANPAAN